MKLTTAPNKHKTETVQIRSNQQTLRHVDLEVFHFRWLKIKGIYAGFPISIPIFSNDLK